MVPLILELASALLLIQQGGSAHPWSFEGWDFRLQGARDFVFHLLVSCARRVAFSAIVIPPLQRAQG